jgi:hypothetical protein
MKNYIIETGFNKESGKVAAKGFDNINQAIDFAEKIKETTGSYPVIRKAIYRIATIDELKTTRG